MKIRKVKAEDLPQLIELCALHAEYENAEYEKQGKQELLRFALFSESPALYCWMED